MANIHTKTLSILNGEDLDAVPVETMFEELYENDGLMNDDINQLKTQIGGTSLTANTINEATSGRGVSADDVLLQDGMVRIISIRAVISSTTTGSAVLTTGTNHGITTGEPAKYVTAAGVSPDTGLSSSAVYYARSLTPTTFSYHPTAADATNNTNPITITSATTGRKFLIAAPLAVPSDGKIWSDATGVHVALGGVIQDLPVSVYSLLSRFSGTKTPIYASASTFTVNRVSERDSGNNVTMTKSSSTIVDITTTGLNGIAQSSNLSGTVTVTSGSASVSFSASQSSNLIANDILVTAGGQARKILSVSGTSAIVESQFSTTETAVTFKRGGRASFYTASTSGTVGTAHYYLYAISDGITTNLILSTRNVAKGETLVDLPSGYIYSKILPFAVTLYNISTAAGVYTGNIIPFAVGAGWPYRPKIRLTTQMSGNYSNVFQQGVTNVLLHGTATSYTGIDLSSFIPSFAKLADLSGTIYGTAVALRPTGGTDTAVMGSASGLLQEVLPDMPVSSTQSIDYKNNAGGGDVSLDVYGYTVTETF
jgi:hypothetical protein